MTPRERFAAALKREPVAGRVLHFELVFFLTMEAFGKVHPSHRNYSQWGQMEEKERQLHREDIADVFIATAERFEHDAIHLVGAAARDVDETLRVVDIIRERTGDTYFLMPSGDCTFSIPNGETMVEFSYRMVDDVQGLKDDARRRMDAAIARAEKMAAHGGVDGFAMCSDYAFNTSPFFRPEQFAELVAPYLKGLIARYHELGFYAVKHTDGNLMPILDQIIDAAPDGLHSIDPQGGMDIAEVKRLYGDRVCLIGNVNCGALDTGTDEEVIASARYALKHGMPGGGYIFSTSNCIYTGMRLERYELMQKVWREEGNYGAAPRVQDAE